MTERVFILERIDRMMARARSQAFRPARIYLGRKEQAEMMGALDKAKPFVAFDHGGREVHYRGAAVAFTDEPTQLRLESTMLALEELVYAHQQDPAIWPDPKELTSNDGSGTEGAPDAPGEPGDDG